VGAEFAIIQRLRLITVLHLVAFGKPEVGKNGINGAFIETDDQRSPLADVGAEKNH
jgi:hypothetical protein